MVTDIFLSPWSSQLFSVISSQSSVKKKTFGNTNFLVCHALALAAVAPSCASR